MIATGSIYQVLTILISALAGLFGVGLGGWIASRNDRARRKADFLSRQLSEFYGPILSLRTETLARGELRTRLGSVAHEEWQRICSQLDGASPEVQREALKERYEKFGKIIEYDNEQLRTTLMPAYRQMLTIFREKMWLAESDTRSYYAALVEFIDIWERFLSETIPGEVITAIGHSEQKLHPFYDHVEHMVNSLQKRLLEDRRK